MNDNLTFKLDQVRDMLSGHRVAVALSGGVDSSLLAGLAIEYAGKGNVTALTVQAENIDPEETANARAIAAFFGIPHQVIIISLLTEPDFTTNPIDRCYFCKRRFLSVIVDEARKAGYDMVIEGTNATDADDYRPGYKAVKELGVISPFLEAGITKDEIRQLARLKALPNKDRPANACLATRIPFGLPVTEAALAKVLSGERALRSLGFTLCRLRYYGDLACIELAPSDLEKLLNRELREDIVNKMKNIGFSRVVLDLDGYRTGSLNPSPATSSFPKRLQS